MSDLFSISTIRGYIATKDIKKGTLILSETPQCLAVGSPSLLQLSYNPVEILLGEGKKFALSIVSAFGRMSKGNQEEFLKLPNRFNDLKSHPESSVQLKYFGSLLKETDCIYEEVDEEDLEIVCIYATNSILFESEGVPIKISQFHHSCWPNACVTYQDHHYEVRTIAKIKAGQEISINRTPCSLLSNLLPKPIRVQILKSLLHRICTCNFCQNSENDRGLLDERHRPHSIIEDDEKMECANVLDLIEQDTTFRSNWATVRYYPQTSPLKDYYAENSAKCKDYIECVKKMFALGKNKKAPPIELYRLVENGYMQSAIIFHVTEHKYQRKLFEKEALNFAKCAEKFEKFLGSEFVKPEVWKSRQNTLAVNPSKVPDFMSSKMRFD